jgi:putative DNA primase/helicase
LNIFQKSLSGRRHETRGDCPVCGYPGAYVESIGKTGQRIGWCASCQDRTAIAAILRGAGGDDRRAAAITAREAEATLQDREDSRIKALAIWRGAAPVTPNDPGGRYLARRGLALLMVSTALRYRPDVPHPDKSRHMGLVALVQDATGHPLGVHRTYLATDGRKARVEPVKASKGPIWGGAIRLTPAAREIIIGEGIETAASAGLLLKLPAWAAISAGNLALGLTLPPEVERVIIAADNDGVNVHGHNPGIEAAEAAARRWMAEGRKVRIVKPDTPGQDFNDVLQARIAAAVMP